MNSKVEKVSENLEAYEIGFEQGRKYERELIMKDFKQFMTNFCNKWSAKELQQEWNNNL